MLRFHFCYTKVRRALAIGADKKKWKCYQYKLLFSMKEADCWGNLCSGRILSEFFPGLEASDFSLLIRILETTPPCSATCWLYNLLYGYDFKVELFKSFTLFQSPTFANYEYSCLQKLPIAVVYFSHPWWDLFMLITWCASPACFPPVPLLYVSIHLPSCWWQVVSLSTKHSSNLPNVAPSFVCDSASICSYLYFFPATYQVLSQLRSIFTAASVWQSPICNPAGPQLK